MLLLLFWSYRRPSRVQPPLVAKGCSPMRSPRLVVLAVCAAVVLCVALIHSAASGQGSATQTATAVSASRPSPADMAVALKAAAILNKCGDCHREDGKTIVHGWMVAGKEVRWGQDILRLIAEGKYVVPGNPEESTLYKWVRDKRHGTTPEGTKLIEQWIARGCIDPKVKPASRPALSEMANARKAMGVLDRCCKCHRHGWQEEGKPKVTWSMNIARLIAEKQVVPGDPDQSPLFTILRDGKHGKYDPAEKMAEDVKTLDQWISQGCIDPKAKPAAKAAGASNGVSSSR